MGAFWFWFFVLLLVIIVADWPTWPYTREREVYRRTGACPFAPSGVAAGLALLFLFLFLFWFGLPAMAWP